MKTFVVVVVFVVMVIIGGRSWGQNLVPNPSFENYIDCPWGFDQVYNCSEWEKVSESPDYLNTCSTNPNVSIPYNTQGYQTPHSGNAYCAVITFCRIGLCNNYREIIQAQLNSVLSIGTEYYISMYAATGMNNLHKYDLAANKLGVRFSTVPYDFNNPPPINNWAHLFTDSIIADTINWTQLNGGFIADSNYQYILIGNFFDDQNIDILKIGTDSTRTYYYIDDICVSTDSIGCLATGVEMINSFSSFSLSPNPVQNFLTINLLSPTATATIAVYDAAGRKIVLPTAISNNKAELTTTTLPNGIYMIQIINDKTGENEVSKFVKQK